MRKMKILFIVFLIMVAIGAFSIAFAKAENANKNAQGQINVGEHRSTVANFVQELLNTAEREKGGIGDQVRVIAQEQNDVEEEITEKIEKVQTRSKVKTFLFGSDYKNLGALRSEMVQTRNRLEQLNRLMEQEQGVEQTNQLLEQVQEMEQESARIEGFIEEHDSKFSLFGWIRKLFRKGE